MSPKVSIVRARGYDSGEIEGAVKEAVDLIGGISNFIKKGEKILLKPNLLSARPPESGVDTHPEIIRAAARLVRKAGADVIVGDSPGGFGFRDPGSTYEASGAKKICEEEDIELVEFDRASNINGIPITAYAGQVDGIISLPKMKTHSLTTITGAVKNSYGLAVGFYKATCHFKAPRPKDFAKYVVSVFECAIPRLVIMDGVIAMEGDGPASGGTLRNAGLILASNDCVACDAIFARLIGLSPLDVEIIAEARDRKLGEARLSAIEMFGEKPEDAALRDFKLPKTSIISKIPRPIFKLIAGGIKFRPKINDAICKKCQLCATSCPAGCVQISDKGSSIDYKKCVSCFCCFEVCPYNAISIKTSLLAKLLGQ
ncbi:MAG: DUF362 domain-containing protein [Candidatus Omnitrophota bacterium]